MNEPSAAERVRPGPASILVWAAWFGLVGGALELAVFLARCWYFDPRNVNAGRHFPWMFPAAGLLIALGPGLVLAVAARVVSARVAVGALSFPAYLGILFRMPIATAACLVLAAGLALRTAGPVGRRAAGFDGFARKSLIVMVGLLVLVAAWCARGRTNPRGTSPAPPGASNVLLIVLDTVRAESLSLYGYGRATTPNLARLAARGVRFDRAFSTAPWTAPSHASMFTGRWCHELSIAWGRPLDGTHPTLAGYLAQRGYETAGFVANTTYCSAETGLDRGFARYDDYDLTFRAVLHCSALVQRALAFLDKHPALASAVVGDRPTSSHRKTAGRINRDVLDWLAARPDPARPFFAFLNYYDAHHPYFVPDDDEEGEAVPLPHFGPPAESAADLRTLRAWWALDKSRLGPREVALARDAYDRCIAYLDRHVGRLLDELERRGVLRDTLVVVTADHGEHLGENGLFGHGASLYRSELHVPLVILAPDGDAGAGRVERAAVSLRDIPATVVARLGLTAGAPFPGRSLLLERGDGPVLSEVAAAPEDDPNQGRSPARLGPMTSLVARGYHYVLNGDGREELFDLDADPRERLDLAATPDAAPALRQFREARRQARATDRVVH